MGEQVFGHGEIESLNPESQENTEKLPIEEIIPVELKREATFTDLIDFVRHFNGNEDAAVLETFLEYSLQNEDFDLSSNIIEVFEAKGYSAEDVENLLPIIFID